MKIIDLYQKLGQTNPLEQSRQAQETAQTQKAQEAQSQPPQGDRVDLSQTSKDLKKVQAVLENTPDVRADKVRAIKEQIETGTYQVDSKKVAQAMLTDLLKDLG
ncbi:flagellar biosynthesis anti-sigma factor FlgM [Thermosulfuriphilus ammonigenes]|uniref:Negative regulator of flagellin synthesis n=1 Tax=Thermosulfuriphilus ammonigenes TaxID=1936021 RepID=A0A6G7PTY7_9BACT|nr:flagellar biosynthesis anti-sigma factor FlgM [Thermosulfuriphilus ammonigenes]MBA2848829.1 negative regulator of flagellin synthesis FlgM [Thermosulfuriphilus ammonigenes]QIJ71047.1 flagellar biosynthesis anti-sigma factor FlgM [Thermosulfuriphilus ammonigenes]